MRFASSQHLLMPKPKLSKFRPMSKDSGSEISKGLSAPNNDKEDKKLDDNHLFVAGHVGDISEAGSINNIRSAANQSVSGFSYSAAVKKQKGLGNIIRRNLENKKRNDTNKACSSANSQDDRMTTRSIVTIKSGMGYLRKVNQYSMVKFLGEGTSGKVYKCTSSEDAKTYAIKVLNKKYLAWKFIDKHTTAYENVQTEIKILKKLDHKNVIKLIEVIDNKDNENLYIVMEYYGNDSLSK